MQQQTSDPNDRPPSPLTTASPRALEQLFDADIEGFLPAELDIYIKHVVEKNRAKLKDFQQAELAKAMAEPKRRVAAQPAPTGKALDDLFNDLF